MGGYRVLGEGLLTHPLYLATPTFIIVQSFSGFNKGVYRAITPFDLIHMSRGIEGGGIFQNAL